MVEILTFSLGLGMGLLLIALQQFRLNRSLKELLLRMESRKQNRDIPTSHFSMTSRLMMAAGQQRQEKVQLKELLDSVQEIIAHAPLAYVQVDRDNYLVWCNVEASRLLNISPPTNDNPRLLLEQVRSYELDRLIEKTRNQQRPDQRRWVLHPLNPDPLNPDPRQSIHLMGHGIPLPGGQVGVFLENQQELFQLAQQRDRWVSDVAHELKTPLTSIRLVAEMLEERVAPAHQPWMQRLLGEVMHLSDLVHDLLDLNLLEQRANQILNPARLDLVHLINSAWQSLEPISTTRAIQMDYQGPAQAQMEADQSRLYRVILNLLDNSIKYSPPNSTITLRLSHSEPDLAPELSPAAASSAEVSPATASSTTALSPNQPTGAASSSTVIASQASALLATPWNPAPHELNRPHYIIDIIDQGPGFPEAALAQIFERFYRVDPARGRPTAYGSSSGGGRSGGTSGSGSSGGSFPPPPSPAANGVRATGSCGLGLAIARQIVLAHGGNVTARNHPETQGAWLQVTIPIHHQQSGGALRA